MLAEPRQTKLFPQALVEKGLDHTEGTDMEGTLADPVKIRQWQVLGGSKTRLY